MAFLISEFLVFFFQFWRSNQVQGVMTFFCFWSLLHNSQKLSGSQQDLVFEFASQLTEIIKFAVR